MWNTLKRIGVRVSQLFEPTLWELRIFSAEHALKNANAERRARFERAYMAALTGQCYGRPNEQSIVEAARAIALETVHQWDAMMAELDGEEGI